MTSSPRLSTRPPLRRLFWVIARLRDGKPRKATRWVLQFGSEAEVLSPASLRKAVADELRRASASYRG